MIIYEKWILNTSAILPCIGGIIAPPKIIIIRNDDPWEVYFFKPVILNEKIHGHMMEQNNPPHKNAYILTSPVLKIPYIIEIVAKQLKINSVLIGLSFPNRNPRICIIIQMENNLRDSISLPLILIKKSTIKNAT